jgi:hypothetical protein
MRTLNQPNTWRNRERDTDCHIRTYNTSSAHGIALVTKELTQKRTVLPFQVRGIIHTITKDDENI